MPCSIWLTLLCRSNSAALLGIRSAALPVAATEAHVLSFYGDMKIALPDRFKDSPKP